MKKILCFGAVYFEINGTGFDFEKTGFSAEKEYIGGPYVTGVGGSTPYFARVCKSLGLDPIVIGKVGNDELGQQVRQMLEHDGIISDLIVSPSHQTSTALNFVNKLGNTIMTVNGDANKSLTPEEVRKKFQNYFKSTNILYLGGCFKMKKFIPEYKEIIQDAKKHGIKVALDHGRITNIVNEEDKKMMRNLVFSVDYYFPNKNEFLTLWGETDIESGLAHLENRANSAILVKDGENGSIGLQNGEIVSMKAFPVRKVINTVGAGDTFNAGFIFSQMEGRNLSDSLKFANAVAALRISRNTLPFYQDVKAFLHY